MATLPVRHQTKALFDGTVEYNQTSHAETKDEFELFDMNLPGLCRGVEDDDDIALDSSQYRSAVDAVSRQNLRTELLKQVREQPWFSQRRLSYQNHSLPGSRRRGSINEESFCYAKALVESDAELERFSKEISTQLHLSEMMEVAVRAQQAADEGCETFSASMASFVPKRAILDSIDERRSDAEAGEQYNGPIVATSGGDRPSQTNPPFRHIAEVIPNFETMNSHMRTHLYRKNVDKKTLIFKEVKESDRIEQNYNLSPRSQGTEITADFFKNLSGYFGTRVRSQEDGSKKDGYDQNIEMTSDENDNGSLEEQIPLNLGIPSIPSVASLASLNSLTVKPSRTVPIISSDADGEASVSSPPPSPGAGSLSENNYKDFVKETLEILNSVSSSTGPTETDHGSTVNDESHSSSCPSSPFHDLEDTAPLPMEITETVLIEQDDADHAATATSTPKPHDYNTPKRLRILKQSDGGEPCTASPDHSRFNFSPSSIVASSVVSPDTSKLEDASIKAYEEAFMKEQTRLLEIPRIGERSPSVTDDLSSPSIDDVAEKAKRTRRIRMLRRRLEDNDTLSVEMREGNTAGMQEEGEEVKLEYSHLNRGPSNLNTDDSTAESNDASLLARPQPEDALEEERNTTTTSLCAPDKTCLMDTATSVAGIPLILKSSSCCGDEEQYFKEAKNDEYMNNYFYLSRLGGSDRRDIDRQSYRRFLCDETISKTGILCQDGITTCNELEFLGVLGSDKEGSQHPNSLRPQAPWWLRQIGFGFMYNSEEKRRMGSHY